MLPADAFCRATRRARRPPLRRGGRRRARGSGTCARGGPDRACGRGRGRAFGAAGHQPGHPRRPAGSDRLPLTSDRRVGNRSRVRGTRDAHRRAGGATGVRNARLTLEAGFTTVRDIGTFRAFTDVALREAIEDGWVVGPRMVCAGAYVTCPGGGGDVTGLAPDVDAVIPRELRFGVSSGVDQVRANVRQILRYGADFIKVIATGAVLTSGTNPGLPEFTEDEIRAAVQETALPEPRRRTRAWGRGHQAGGPRRRPLHRARLAHR